MSDKEPEIKSRVENRITGRYHYISYDDGETWEFVSRETSENLQRAEQLAHEQWRVQLECK